MGEEFVAVGLSDIIQYACSFFVVPGSLVCGLLVSRPAGNPPSPYPGPSRASKLPRRRCSSWLSINHYMAVCCFFSLIPRPWFYSWTEHASGTSTKILKIIFKYFQHCIITHNSTKKYIYMSTSACSGNTNKQTKTKSHQQSCSRSAACLPWCSLRWGRCRPAWGAKRQQKAHGFWFCSLHVHNPIYSDTVTPASPKKTLKHPENTFKPVSTAISQQKYN